MDLQAGTQEKETNLWKWQLQTSSDWNSKNVVNACSKKVETNSANSLLGQQHCTDDIDQVILSKTHNKKVNKNIRVHTW